MALGRLPDMPHPLEGQFSAEESARLIRNYRYAVERMMRMLAGWIALTPELSAKLLMGRHVWDNAQHCDAFGRRLPELRSPANGSAPASPGVVEFLDALEGLVAPHETAERLVGVYRVLKPHLLAVYGEHLERANPVYEPPTRRILARCIEDERGHVAAGEAVLRHLLRSPALEARGDRCRRRLADLLVAAGGVTGQGVPAPAGTSPEVSPELSEDAREFIRLEAPRVSWSFPEGLSEALRGLGDALVTGNEAGLRRWLAPGTGLPDLPGGMQGVRFSAHRPVALARVGQHPVTKLRLDGPDGAMTVMTRWVPGEGGWRAAAVEIVGIHSASPADPS